MVIDFVRKLPRQMLFIASTYLHFSILFYDPLNVLFWPKLNDSISRIFKMLALSFNTCRKSVAKSQQRVQTVLCCR